MMNKTLLMSVLLVMVGSAVRAESAGVEYLYACRNCSKRFVGFVVQTENAHTRNDDKVVGFQGQNLNLAFIAGQDDSVDSDNGRVFIGVNKYEYTIITCPRCGYSFLHKHYFQFKPGQKIQQKINSVLKPRMEAYYHQEISDLTGNTQQELRRLEQQKSIPVKLKYRNALDTYLWHGFSPSFRAKLALNGAWAFRNKVCAPFTLNDRGFNRALARLDERMEAEFKPQLLQIKDQNARVRNEVLRRLLADTLKEGRLEDIERFVVCNVLIGLCDRLGRHAEVEHYSAQAAEAAAENIRLKAYLVKIKEWLDTEQDFLKTAYDLTYEGLQQSNYSRQEVHAAVYMLGELSKRTGRVNTAAFWFKLLNGSKEISDTLQVNVTARTSELQSIMLTAAGTDTVSPEAQLLADRIRAGLGTLEYYVRSGQAQKGLEYGVCKQVMRRIGTALLIYKDEYGIYPDKLQDLWDEKMIPGLASVNFFCCPVTGKPYTYVPAKVGFMVWPLLTDSEGHAWNGKPDHFGIYHTNGLFKVEEAIPAELQ